MVFVSAEYCVLMYVQLKQGHQQASNQKLHVTDALSTKLPQTCNTAQTKNCDDILQWQNFIMQQNICRY